MPKSKMPNMHSKISVFEDNSIGVNSASKLQEVSDVDVVLRPECSSFIDVLRHYWLHGSVALLVVMQAFMPIYKSIPLAQVFTFAYIAIITSFCAKQKVGNALLSTGAFMQGIKVFFIVLIGANLAYLFQGVCRELFGLGMPTEWYNSPLLCLLLLFASNYCIFFCYNAFFNNHSKLGKDYSILSSNRWRLVSFIQILTALLIAVGFLAVIYIVATCTMRNVLAGQIDNSSMPYLILAVQAYLCCIMFSIPLLLYWTFNIKDIGRIYLPIFIFIVFTVIVLFTGNTAVNLLAGLNATSQALLVDDFTKYPAIFIISAPIFVLLNRRGIFFVFCGFSILVFVWAVLFLLGVVPSFLLVFPQSIENAFTLPQALFGAGFPDAGDCNGVFTPVSTLLDGHNIDVLILHRKLVPEKISTSFVEMVVSPLNSILRTGGLFYLGSLLLTFNVILYNFLNLGFNLKIKKTLYMSIYNLFSMCMRVGAFLIWFFVCIKYGLSSQWLNGCVVTTALLFFITNQLELEKIGLYNSSRK